MPLKFLSGASVAEHTVLNGASVTKIHSKLVLESLQAYDLAEVLWKRVPQHRRGQNRATVPRLPIN